MRPQASPRDLATPRIPGADGFDFLGWFRNGWFGADLADEESGSCTGTTKSLFFEPLQVQDAPSWKNVGDGYGRYKEEKTYQFRGDGAGDYKKKVTTTFTGCEPRRCTICLCVMFGLALGSAGLYMLAWQSGNLKILLAAWQPRPVSVGDKMPPMPYDCQSRQGLVLKKARWCCSNVGIFCSEAAPKSPSHQPDLHKIAGGFNMSVESFGDVGAAPRWPLMVNSVDSAFSQAVDIDADGLSEFGVRQLDQTLHPGQAGGRQKVTTELAVHYELATQDLRHSTQQLQEEYFRRITKQLDGVCNPVSSEYHAFQKVMLNKTGAKVIKIVCPKRLDGVAEAPSTEQPLATEAASELLGVQYVFRGLGSAIDARKRCGVHGDYDGLAMPKTVGEERALEKAVHEAKNMCSFEHHERAGIPGYNMKHFGNETAESCQDKCAEVSSCKAVEFATDRDAEGIAAYSPGTCLFQASNEGAQAASPRFRNLDLYIKRGNCEVGRMEANSNIWLAAHWSEYRDTDRNSGSKHGQWEWDDGSPIGLQRSALLRVTSLEHDVDSWRRKPWLSMSSEGKWQTAPLMLALGIFCEQRKTSKRSEEYHCEGIASDASEDTEWVKARHKWCCKQKGLGCPSETTTKMRYVFAGFGSTADAHRRCSAYQGLAMPKTLEQQSALHEAVETTVAAGNLSAHWPHNTVWLGGHWDASGGVHATGQWKWDDGSPISARLPAAEKLMRLHASSKGHQHGEPWLCMLIDGKWEDSAPVHKFGIMCEEEVAKSAPLRGG